jgi:membrane protease YdiL (CAAX protease family)
MKNSDEAGRRGTVGAVSVENGVERTAWQRPVGVAVATTLVVTVLSYVVPDAHAASAVGLAFLAATFIFALKKGEPDAARRFGLSLGGLLDPEPIDFKRLARSAATELGVALALGAVVFPLFWVGFVAWWSPRASFHPASPRGLLDEAFGQFLVIALPEEAFYRGYLQTRLDCVWPPRWSVLGARIGPALLVTSVVFALGHVATEVHPSRLAVFFPSLLFGWLRSRRRGIGSAAAFHALCNLFAAYLGRSYGLGG